MSLWIEIHCDIRAQAPQEWRKLHVLDHFCHSDAGANVADLFHNGATNASKAVRFLNKRARELGWVYTSKHEWACPNCKTTL